MCLSVCECVIYLKHSHTSPTAAADTLTGSTSNSAVTVVCAPWWSASVAVNVMVARAASSGSWATVQGSGCRPEVSGTVKPLSGSWKLKSNSTSSTLPSLRSRRRGGSIYDACTCDAMSRMATIFCMPACVHICICICICPNTQPATMCHVIVGMNFLSG